MTLRSIFDPRRSIHYRPSKCDHAVESAVNGVYSAHGEQGLKRLLNSVSRRIAESKNNDGQDEGEIPVPVASSTATRLSRLRRRGDS